MTLIWICSAWIVGIFVADQAGLPGLPLGIVAAAACVLALLWRKSVVALPLVLLAAFAFGGLRTATARPANDQTAVWQHTGKRVSLRGAVVKPPTWDDNHQTIVLDTSALTVDGTQQPVHGLVQLYLPAVPQIDYGQAISATGRLDLPRSGDLFDYRAYLARHSIYAVMNFPRVDTQGQARHLAPLASLMRMNTHLRAVLQRLLPEPHAGLLAGMLLGTQSAIPEPVLADFRTTGTSHLLVISGWNISVLLGAIVGGLIASGVSRRRAALLALPVLPMYVLFVGASPSVVRAGIMGALVLWATIAEREADAWTGLALACALLTLLDPNVLWDTSFLLSALGTAGILWWSSRMRERLALLSGSGPLGLRLLGVIGASLVPTLGALVLVLPLSLYQFGTLSTIAPLANLLLAPAIPPAMFFGALAAAVGLLALPVGQMIALLAWPFTAWLLEGTHLLAGLPWAAFEVPRFGVWWVWFCYALLAALGASQVWQQRRIGSSTPLA